MAYPPYIREKARQLRREKKMTIDELAECLAISRTTIYYWVRHMPLGQTRDGLRPSSARHEPTRRSIASFATRPMTRRSSTM